MLVVYLTRFEIRRRSRSAVLGDLTEWATALLQVDVEELLSDGEVRADDGGTGEGG